MRSAFLLWVKLCSILLATRIGDTVEAASPNLLRNSGFLQCANPGVPDWWGTGAPEQIQNWEGCYGVDVEAPFPNVQSLRLHIEDERNAFAVQSYAYPLPGGREYTFSVYLKGSVPGMRSFLWIGDRSREVRTTTRWERYTFTATPDKGHWAHGRLVVRFSIHSAGTLWVAAPQLEFGDQATEYRPADADLAPAGKAASGPSIPPHPLPLPSARCPRTDSPPTIDGKLDDPCYGQATLLTNFRVMQTGSPATVRTDCYVVRDKANLYLAFRCYEPEMEKVIAKASTRDAAVFSDDSIEVFLQPDPKSADYLHFAVNLLGAQYDEKQYETGWNADWQAAVQKGEKEWCVEMCLPFASLGLTPRTQETWRVNFCRNRPHGEEQYTEWSCTYIGFHVPSRFGKLSGFTRRDLEGMFKEPSPPQKPEQVSAPRVAPLLATFEFSFYTTEQTARLWVKSNLQADALIEIAPQSNSMSSGLSVTSKLLPKGSARFFPLDISALAAGEYTVEIVAREKSSGDELARATTSLVKLSPAPCEVKINRVNRSLVVNGKPFLVYAQGIHGRRGGWWLEDIAAHGLNTVIPGVEAYRSDEQLNKDEPQIRAFLDECQKLGLKVIMWLHPGGGSYPPMREAVVRTIKRLKDHPAIIAWYLVDEPEGWWSSQEGGKKEDDLIDLYRAAKEADPYRPAQINWYAWTKGKGGYGSLDATDIGSLDRYPVGRGTNAIKAVGDIVQIMNDDCRPRFQPTAFWVQMYGYDDAVREPTPAEERGMTYVCLIHGMRLIYYFIYKPMSRDLWESMKPLGDELRVLQPILTDPEANELAVGIQGKVVHYCLWERGGKHYLIACNGSDEGVEVTFDLSRFIKGPLPHKATTLFAKQPIHLKGGRLKTTFKPNERLVVELE